MNKFCEVIYQNPNVHTQFTQRSQSIPWGLSRLLSPSLNKPGKLVVNTKWIATTRVVGLNKMIMYYEDIGLSLGTQEWMTLGLKDKLELHTWMPSRPLLHQCSSLGPAFLCLPADLCFVSWSARWEIWLPTVPEFACHCQVIWWGFQLTWSQILLKGILVRLPASWEHWVVPVVSQSHCDHGDERMHMDMCLQAGSGMYHPSTQ